MGSHNKKKIIFSVGGSIIVPEGGINTDFLRDLSFFVRNQLAQDTKRQFFLVAGGGTTARKYRDAGKAVLERELTNEDLDWIGLHATRLNAQLIKTIFKDIAHPHIIKNYDIIRKVKEPVVLAAGWKPGWSTDYCATLLCEDYDVDTIINISNVTQVYDKDPNKFPDAKPIDHMSWKDFRKMVGDKWIPGMHAPFDPIAARKAQELGTKVVVLSGSDFENIKRYFRGEKFVGTIIE